MCIRDRNSSSGGVGKTALEMKSISTFLPQWDISTFADFDSTTTWYIEEGKDYPKPVSYTHLDVYKRQLMKFLKSGDLLLTDLY